MMEGVLYNYRLDHKNRKAAKQSGELGTVYYDAGYDLRYTFTKAFGSSYFQERYLESVGLSADVNFELCCDGKPLPKILVGETWLNEPAIWSGRGVNLLPLRMVVESAGGTVNWKPDSTEVELNGIRCRLIGNGTLQMRAEWTDAHDISHRMKIFCIRVYGNTYVETSLLTEVFGLEVVWNADDQTYIIPKD